VVVATCTGRQAYVIDDDRTTPGGTDVDVGLFVLLYPRRGTVRCRDG
jgi:hypothetical protein